MKIRSWLMSLSLALATVVSLTTFATPASAGDTHEYAMIDTCYHWLNKEHLDAKIEYARTHDGQFLFFGPSPAYCWRSPLGSFKAWEDHGDYLIRVKFKPGTQVLHHPRSFNNYAAMTAPVYYSNDNAWHEYTFTPDAVESWSIYRPETSVEMAAEIRFYESGLATANDVFYPWSSFNVDFMKTNTANAIALNNAGAEAGLSHIYGDHPEHHFETAYPQPWSKFLVRGKQMKVVELPKIKVIEASFGLNLSAKNKGNATAKAAGFCDGKTQCLYLASVKYLDINPEPDKQKSFDISWTCGKNPKVQTHHEDAPAEGQRIKVFAMNCPVE